MCGDLNGVHLGTTHGVGKEVKHGIAVIEVSEFNSEAICDLRAVWRPAWPQRPPKWLLYKAVIEYAHGYQGNQGGQFQI